ncbi:Suppressor of the cold-sensitive snRNP bioproteinsis mutant brr1-1 [Perkinsus olseni]|uniref:subtilisin n=1 Tax=Perkinsus olseni TaxID=32597 RepID=A0A7J6NUP4_PEROL|nr:Suppressor of the cold-sensitive snRNP bioproteinsis mutant brr1-1 [Perkinsus olseni]
MRVPYRLLVVFPICCLGTPDTLLSITSSVSEGGLSATSSSTAMVDIRSLPALLKTSSNPKARRLQQSTPFIEKCLNAPRAVDTLRHLGVQAVHTDTDECQLSHEELKAYVEEAAPALGLEVILERNSEVSLQVVEEARDGDTIHGIDYSKTAAAVNDARADEQWNLDLINLPEAWAAWEAVMAARRDREESEDVGDVKGHGTHCGGVLGATTNNSLGIAGISRAKIMPIRVLGPGGKGSVMEVMAGIDFAVQQKVDILSNSYAGSIRSELLKRSISLTAELGMLFVCAAGNEGKDISVKKAYPCAFTEELDNILCVGSSDKDLPYILARHSNYAPYLDVAAPGVQILSTFPGRSYRFMTGTSMATPHVSGVAAMLMQMGLSARDARAVIKNSTEVLENAFFVPVVKYGRLNALKAVRAAAVLPTVPPKPRRSLGGGNCVPSETPDTPGRSWAPRGSVLASLLFVTVATLPLL